jgi:pimeloyl-ACP methyl ester carboxylesterase
VSAARIVNDLEERSFSTGAIDINFAEGPDNGIPLVLLHGGSARWQSWRWVIPALRGRTHLFAPDLRGHGRSTWVPGQYRLFDYASDVEAFLEGVVREPVILLGHSLGGEVALIVASERPDLVRGVIDEDGPLSAESARRAITPTRPMLLAMRDLAGSSSPDDELTMKVADLRIGVGGDETMRFGDFAGEDEIAWWAETLRHHDPSMLDAVIEFDRMHGGYGAEVLSRIKCPVAIFRADPSHGGVSDDDVERALSLLRDARSITFDGVGHSIHLEAPDLFIEHVFTVLDELDAPSGPGLLTPTAT